MLAYIVRRCLLLIPTLLIVAVVAFAVVHMMPGDPVRMMLGDYAPEDQVIQIRKQLGLDQPIIKQFLVWLTRVVQGDFGTSIFLTKSISEVVSSRMEPTILLAILGQTIGILLGVPLGILAAVKHRKWMDQTAIVTSLIGISIPSFMVGIGLVLLFGVQYKLFPVSGYRPLSEVGIGVLYYLFLPALSLGIAQSGIIARMTRSAMLDVLLQDYIRTARAKGLGEFYVVMKHALRNALIPVVAIIGLSMGTLLGGTWIIESIFAIPGTGYLAISSIMRRDYFVIQGCMIWVAMVYLLVNLITDLCYAAINPRIRFHQ
jgi:peptide/nickel transport system permease protein